MISTEEQNHIKLILRSEDHGDGWRLVSQTLWKMVKGYSLKNPELFEIDEENRRIRLTEAGNVVARYLT